MIRDRLSPSRIVTYDSCPRKYWYRYVEKIKEPETLHTVRGTLFHKVLEDFYSVFNVKNVKTSGWQELSKIFEKVLIHLLELEWNKLTSQKKELFLGEEEKWKEETKDFLKFFAIKEAYRIHNFLKKNDKDDNWFKANFEREFVPRSREEYIGLEDIHGYLDKTVNVFGRGVGIIDYKTSEYKMPHAIDESYLLQLKAYAYMFKKKNNELPVYLSIYYAKNGESVYYKTSEEDVKEIEEVISEIKTLTKEVQSFPRNVTNLCKYCFFKGTCKPWEESDLQGLKD